MEKLPSISVSCRAVPELKPKEHSKPTTDDRIPVQWKVTTISLPLSFIHPLMSSICLPIFLLSSFKSPLAFRSWEISCCNSASRSCFVLRASSKFWKKKSVRLTYCPAVRLHKCSILVQVYKERNEMITELLDSLLSISCLDETTALVELRPTRREKCRHFSSWSLRFLSRLCLH